MRLATIRTAEGTRAVRVEGDVLVDLGTSDVCALLARPGWEELAAADGNGTTYAADSVTFAPLLPRPSKVVCVGLNYRNHIIEMGRDLPEYPTLFAKFAEALIGAEDDIVRPPETECLDWEAEMGICIGRAVRRARGKEAEAAIAGFTVVNDISARDWQFRTREWLQGKTWAGSTPVGPYLVTPDELPGGVRPQLVLTLTVDGELMQKESTADLLFSPVALVEYVSTIVPLLPGDLIATGTPGGVGQARQPQRFLSGGERVVAEIEQLGRCQNLVVTEAL